LETIPSSARQAYLDGERCGVPPDGTTTFSQSRPRPMRGNADALVYFLFDLLLYLDGDDTSAAPLLERKQRLQALLSQARSPLHYTDHQAGHGRAFHKKAWAMASSRARCG
jgi:bifunctional non-homologous end joining protein LigD